MRQRKNTAETEVSQAASDDLTTGYTVPPQHTQPPQHHQPSQPAQQAQSPPQIQLSKVSLFCCQKKRSTKSP